MQNNFTPEDYSKKFREPILHPVGAALLGIFGVFITFQIIGGLLSALIIGIDMKNLDGNTLRITNTVMQYLFILFPALLFTKLVYFEIKDIIHFELPKVEDLLLHLVGLGVLIFLLDKFSVLQNYAIYSLADNSPFVSRIVELIKQFNDMLMDTYSKVIVADNPATLILVIFSIALTPAICEEVLFRGYVQASFLKKLSPVASIALTSIFFSLFHFNFFGTTALFLLSLYLGYAGYKTGTILIPMILHFANNTFSVIMFNYAGVTESATMDVRTEYELGTTVLYFFILLLVFIGVIILQNRLHNNSGGKNDLPEM